MLRSQRCLDVVWCGSSEDTVPIDSMLSRYLLLLEHEGRKSTRVEKAMCRDPQAFVCS